MRYVLTCFVALFLFHPSFCQDTFTLSGTVKDASDGEALIGVNVYAREQKVGVSTNVYGFYSITLPKGMHTLVITYVGYHKVEKEIELNEDTTLNLELSEAGNVLDEVVVTAEKEDHNVKSVEMSVNKVEMRTIRKMPALLGEVDVIRSIQFLPGVSSVGEGSSGFNV
ncbi:MAG: carboxypeptidase-like regulatory domain-containing protein, partial [Leadbetterella sp.]|nr:carboxypeptidase-like regulatory domain-containing protein [Leadbetterella sp.]